VKEAQKKGIPMAVLKDGTWGLDLGKKGEGMVSDGLKSGSNNDA
jgi:hypothetical protein